MYRTVHVVHGSIEGRLETVFYELAEGSGLGARVDEEAVSIFEKGGTTFRALGIDPLGAITPRAFFLEVPPEGEGKVRKTFLDTGPQDVRIATLGPSEERIILNWKRGHLPCTDTIRMNWKSTMRGPS